jgi:acetyl-CoA carboxylase biotin carboxyl carrier protein
MNEIRPRDIEALLETFEASDWSEMKLKLDGLELFFSKTPGARPPQGHAEPAAPAPTAPAAPASSPPSGAAARHGGAPDHWVTVRAPNLGTFYRAPKPGAPPYVKIGQHVEPLTELCLIEVMKLFTSVFAGVSGVVRQVLVEDAELVEFDQALFLIEPDA